MNQRYLEEMANLLVFHKILARQSDLSKENLEEKIMRFQEKEDLLIDGVVGPETRWALHFPWVMQAPKHLFVRCEADVIEGIDGFDSIVLREDAAKNYRMLRNEVQDQGGVITSAGGRRHLSVGAGTHRSAKSMHYTGLAFDLSVTSGFFKPQTDPFVITKGDEAHWNVWCRAQGGQDLELSAIYWEHWNSGEDLKKTVAGKFINFTKLCITNGFHPIGPRAAFRRSSDRKYLSSEWWHFQANDLLVPKLSQFGIELLKIDGYTPASIQAENRNIWGNRKATFKVDWS